MTSTLIYVHNGWSFKLDVNGLTITGHGETIAFGKGVKIIASELVPFAFGWVAAKIHTAQGRIAE